MRQLVQPAPGLYPSHHQPEQRAEAEVWERLGEQRPSDWYIWHHVVGGRGIREHEGDFILAIPGHGIVILECKGGRLERRDGRWYQNGALLHPQPGEQIYKFKRSFLSDLRRLCPDHPEVTHAVVFPGTSRPSAPDHGGELVLYREDLHYFAQGGAERLLQAFSGAPYRSKDLSWIAALHAMWGPDWRPTRTFTRNPDRADQVWRQLTPEQEAVLGCLDESRRIVVEGPPGSGKSLLVMALADKFAAAGKRVLVLTYTRAIAAEMRAAGLSSVYPIRDLALELGRELGCVKGDDVESWGTPEWESMINAVVASLAASSARPDALTHDVVIVDEAQDLGEVDWAVVDRAVGDDAALWIFQDEGQRTMRHARGVEPPARIRSTARFRLHGGHRSPPELLRLATRIRDGVADTLDAHERALLGESVSVVRLPDGATDEARIAATETAIRAALSLDEIAPEDVAVVSLGTMKKNRVLSLATLADRPTRRADDAPAPGAIVCDTVLRMKGLERPVVVLVDFDCTYDAARASSTYLALTRASSHCIVVAAAGDVQAPALRGLIEG